MSVETQPSTINPEDSGLRPETIQEINTISSPEVVSPEHSIGAINVLAAANRIADFLDARQSAKDVRELNTDHTEALAEYRDRDHSGYVNHLAKLSDTQIEGDLIGTEEIQTFAEDSLNRENRIEDRNEAIDKAKSKLRGFGRSALDILRKTGRITAAVGIGVGIIAGRGIARGARIAGDATLNAADSVVGFVDDRIDQVKTTAKDTVASVKDAYSDVKVSATNTYTEKKWRATNAIEDKISQTQYRVKRGILNSQINLAGLNPTEKIRDKVDLKKAEIHDAAFEFSMMRKAYQEKAKAALLRRVDRIRAFKNRSVERVVTLKDTGVEKFNDARDKTTRRAQRIGHRAMTFVSVASEAGQVFIDNMKAIQEDEATINSAQ